MANPRNVNIAIKMCIIMPPWFRNQTGKMVGGNCSIAGAVQFSRRFLYVRYGPFSVTGAGWAVVVDDANGSDDGETDAISSPSFVGEMDVNFGEIVE